MHHIRYVCNVAAFICGKKHAQVLATKGGAIGFQVHDRGKIPQHHEILISRSPCWVLGGEGRLH